MAIATLMATAAPTGSLVVPLGFGLGASIATLAGGLLALRLATRITLLLGLTAGIVLGVAIFDLVPEALALKSGTTPARATLAWVAVGLCGYMLFGRALATSRRAGPWRAHLGPATLTLHSFLDGVGIGIAFQLSPATGWLVALAVLTHDVADGVNTVSLCLAAERERAARAWLWVNGAAPLLGVLAGMVMRVPLALTGPLLAGFAGVFLYIGACELLPRSHALDPRLRTTFASLAGVALMFWVTTVAH